MESLALRRKIKDRLLELSPRAFEFFAGDLLEYLGLESVTVTRQKGDGGVDAVCQLVSGTWFRIPAGVQVKRQRRPVHRPEMDRFVGALANRFACGIFITTASFSRMSLEKAASSIPRVSTIDGDQVSHVMVEKGIGTRGGLDAIDEGYFGIFESRVRVVAERSAEYEVGAPLELDLKDDLVSLRALSYALHVDTTTIRNWMDRGQLRPDYDGSAEARDGLFFRRHRISEIRQQFGLGKTPESRDEWVESFLRFAMHGRLNKSYKPVMLLALLDVVKSDGTVDEDTLVDAFRAFYLARRARGLPAEVESSLLNRPDAASRSEIGQLLIRYPLDRFIIQGYVEHHPRERLIRVRAEVWEGLRFQDVLALRHSLNDQLDRYFSELDRGSS